MTSKFSLTLGWLSRGLNNQAQAFTTEQVSRYTLRLKFVTNELACFCHRFKSKTNFCLWGNVVKHLLYRLCGTIFFVLCRKKALIMR